MHSTRRISATLCLCIAGISGVTYAAFAAPPDQKLPAFPIYRFGVAPNDGITPSGGVVQDSQGRLYGGTQYGGATNQGIIYRLTPHPGGKWTEEILHSFNGTDGYIPAGPLTLDASGNVYGGTLGGGANNSGVAFRLTDANGSWNLTILHSFGAPQDGAALYSGLVFGPDGRLFGVTTGGGSSSFGTAFELSPNGDTDFYAKIHDFAGGSDGAAPESGLIPYKDRLVGTTFGGGPTNHGTIFTLSKNGAGEWKERVVYNFDTSGQDVSGPFTAQGFASDHHGGFIGCGGGLSANKGGVFAVNPSSVEGTPWTETILYAFGQNSVDPRGFCDLAAGPSDVIYATSLFGGGATNPHGVVFKLSPPSGENPTWTETNLFNLSPGAFLGYNPVGAPVRHNRVFYAVSSASRPGTSGLDFVFATP